MQKPIYPFYVIWANYVLKDEISNGLEQIKNLKVKTSDDVAGFYQNGFHHQLEKTGNYRRSQKHGKSQIGVYRFLHLHSSNVMTTFQLNIMVWYPNIVCGDFTIVWFLTGVSSSMSFKVLLDSLK